MLQKDIDRALRMIEDEGSLSNRDYDRLILAVKASADAAKQYKDDLHDAIALEYGEDEAARLKRGGDMVPGFLIRARSLGDYPAEADLAGLLVDRNGDVVGFYHGGEVAYPRPKDYTLRGAAVIDENAEAHRNVLAAAEAIVHGSSGHPRDPYYASKRSRY